jgi:hypothetical protein
MFVTPSGIRIRILVTVAPACSGTTSKTRQDQVPALAQAFEELLSQ